MPKANSAQSKSRAAPYPARSPLQSKDANAAPLGSTEHVKHSMIDMGFQVSNKRSKSPAPHPPSDPNITEPPPRLPSPNIYSDARSFLDIQLSTLPNSPLPPIYDTCTQIRQKITKLVNNKDPSLEDGIRGETKVDSSPKPWTIKAFCEAIGGVHHGSYDKFMKKTGTMGGAASGVYSAAYIFFEKKRVWEKKPKSGARKKVEEENPMGLAVMDESSHASVTKAIGNRGTGKRRWIFARTPGGGIRRKLEKKFRRGSCTGGLLFD